MGDIVIELTKGLSPKKSMTFSPGKPAETFSLGQQGVWSVSGAGVGGVHAYLFFDGTTLFVASADPAASTSVDGRKVTSDWFPLAPPCEVAVGEARLRVSGGAVAGGHAEAGAGGIIEENPTMAMDPMKAMAMMPGATAATPGESTRFQPDAPPAGPPMMGFPGMQPMAPMAGAAGSPPGAPPPAGGGSAIAKMKADWEAATPSRRATILAIPCVLIAAYLLFAEDEPETVTSTKPAVTASASVAAKPPEPPPTRVVSPPLPATAAATAVAAAGPAGAAAAAAPEPAAKTGKDKDVFVKTTQRLAADAIAAGNFAEALKLYQQLSRENPNDPAFKEAIRILKARQ
jgi:hypothetical protein